ncbi:hypothetical protein [Streptomyces sp. NBC_00045]|uniref:hypothetical protein n=1 Tax=Streptomyces sp. NBC_00045 TaxID=2975625 RepID=UPI003244FBC8
MLSAASGHERLKALTADDWTVMVAIIAAVVAVWQSAIARPSAGRQLALAERIHREQNEPYVIVDIQPDPRRRGAPAGRREHRPDRRP